jgi:hypothetical protein
VVGAKKLVVAEIARCDGDVQLGFAGWGIGKASGKAVVITAALVTDGKTKLHALVTTALPYFHNCLKVAERAVSIAFS